MKYLLATLLITINLMSFGQPQNQAPQVIVNQKQLDDWQINDFQSKYGIQMQAGDYWYDQLSGAWGITGGPTLGFLPADLGLGGSLQSTASKGNTGVFVNGRELHVYDVAQLRNLLGAVYQGRYWLDAYGNTGYEGGPALLNLLEVSRNQQSSYYRNSYTGIGAGSSGGTSYVMGKDWSVIVDH